MSQLLGEIKLIAYNDTPAGWIKCEGQSLDINTYPMLYMMLGTKFGQEDKFKFTLPDLRDKAPSDLVYCIAFEGELPGFQDKREEGRHGL